MTTPAARPSADAGDRDLVVMTEASRVLTSTLDLSEVLDRLAATARVRLEVDIVRVWLLDEEPPSLVLRAETGTATRATAMTGRMPLTEGMAGWVMREGSPLVVEDVYADSRLKNRGWFEAEHVRSAVAVPLLLDMVPVGVLACLSRTPRVFSPADVAVAENLVAPAAVAVRNATVHAEALSRLEEIQAFQRLAAETLASPDVETALRAVVRETQNLLHSDAAVCSPVDQTTLEVSGGVALGVRIDEFPRFRLAPGEGLAGLVAATSRPVRTDDYFADARFGRAEERDTLARREGIVAAIVAPVLDPSGQILSLLWAFNRSPTPFTTAAEERLTRLAQHAALAIGTTRAFEDERRRAAETAALLAISRACTSTFELRPLLRELTRQSARALGAERCTVNLWQGTRLLPVMAQYADGRLDEGQWARFQRLAAGGVEQAAVDAEAVRTRGPIQIEDALASSLVPREWVEAFGIRSILVVPLLVTDRVIGTLAFDDSRVPRRWSSAQLDLAMTVAAQIALAVDNAHHFEAAEQRAREVEALAAVGETLASTLEISEVLETVTESALKLIGAPKAVLWELDSERGELRTRAVRGTPLPVGFRIPLGQGAAGAAAQRRAAVWSADVEKDPPPAYAEIHAPTGKPLGDAFRAAAFRAVLAVPVVSRDAVLGAVVVLWDEVHEPDARETRLLTALARQAGIAMDNARLVADMRRALEELKAAQDTLVRGATLRAVGELAAGAAHHLNNLLAVVLGRTQLLLMKSPPAEMVQSLKTIERSAVDAADTVRRIQAFSTTDRRPEAAPLELNAAIQDALQLTRSRWEHEAQLRGARVEMVFVPGAVPQVHGRAADIREAIANLVLNAVDAMPAGGRLSIRTWREGARAMVAVTDSGTGMPEDVRRRAFEPFFTTKGVKRTGLGLPVVYGAIRRHGGDVTMDSTEGRGTTVTFWLPIGSPAAAAEAPVPDGGARPAAILVIDDEAAVRQLVTEVLRARGHSVTAAGSGREGLERFRVGRFDLVITDLGMPDLTGWDVARAVHGTSPALPVLVLTGWADAVEAPSDVAVTGILTKPFDVTKLAESVAVALRAATI